MNLRYFVGINIVLALLSAFSISSSAQAQANACRIVPDAYQQDGSVSPTVTCVAPREGTPGPSRYLFDSSALPPRHPPTPRAWRACEPRECAMTPVQVQVVRVAFADMGETRTVYAESNVTRAPAGARLHTGERVWLTYTCSIVQQDDDYCGRMRSHVADLMSTGTPNLETYIGDSDFGLVIDLHVVRILRVLPNTAPLHHDMGPMIVEHPISIPRSRPGPVQSGAAAS